MKLYYSPGACSLSPHIILIESGIPFTLDRVDIASGITESGEVFSRVNPKGYVPALRLDTGEVLTEGAAIVQYLADSRPQSGLAQAAGTIERARLQEHLNFISSELHKAFTPLFTSNAPAESKASAPATIGRKLDYIESQLADGRSFLMGDRFSVADAYLFAVASWTIPTGIGLDKWPHLKALVSRITERPSVRTAMLSEGLIAA